MQRDNHITGAVRHAAGFVRGREHERFTAGKSFSGKVGVAGGRSGFLHQFRGQLGRRFAVGIGFCFCGRNRLRGNRWQVASDGIYLLGGL